MKTHYDRLQLTPLASQDAILAAHARLLAAVDDTAADASAQRKQLNDACFTLCDPDRRERYDRQLLGIEMPAGAPVRKSLFRSKVTPVLLWLGACAVAFAYLQTNRNSQQRVVALQEQRMRDIAAAEERQANPVDAADREAERLRREAAMREREAAQKQHELERAEREQQRAFEQARREADDNMRRRQAAEAQAEREHQRELENTERKLKQAQENELRDAQRRLAREKAIARQMEAENDRYRRPTPY